MKHCLIDMPCINCECLTGLPLIRGGPDDTWRGAMVFSPEQTFFFVPNQKQAFFFSQAKERAIPLFI